MFIAISGLAIGALALALAILATSRAIPPLQASLREDGMWDIHNPGPDTLVIVAAYTVDEDQRRKPLGRWVGAEERSEMLHMRMLIGTTENPWCAGRQLPPHVVHVLEPGSVGRSVHVEYRIAGPIGRWPTKTFSPPWE